MIPNLSITGWSSVTGAGAGGGYSFTDVDFGGVELPGQAVEFSFEKVAALATSGVRASRKVIVNDAALWAPGITPKVEDRVTLKESAGAGTYTTRVMRVAGFKGPPAASEGCVRAWELWLGEVGG